MTATEDNWHLTLFSRSVMKQAKLREILRFLPETRDRVCLDIGGDNGVISYHLRRRGGTWHSADLTEEAVSSIRELVAENCLVFDGGSTPFEDGFFDIVVVIDFFEHIHDDNGFAAELGRILKEDGLLLVNVPHYKRVGLIRPLRMLLGLTDEKHGHLRPGYTRQGLKELLSPHFTITRERSYSRFFSEFIDALLSFAYTNFGSGKGKESAKGVLVTGQDMKKSGGMFRLLSLAYPFIWLISRLDALLFFTRGYSLIVSARKTSR